MTPKDDFARSPVGRGLLAASATILTLLAGTLFMRPAVYPFLVWHRFLPVVAAAVAAALGTSLAHLGGGRSRQQNRPIHGSSGTGAAVGEAVIVLAPGVVVGVAVLLLLRAGMLGYAQ